MKRLPKHEKLKYVLNSQEKGIRRQNIAKNMGYDRIDSLDRFMKNQGYINIDNVYVLQMDDSCPIQTDVLQMEGSCPTIDLVQSENKERLLDIVENHGKIMNMIQWFENMEDTCPTQIIEVNTGLSIDYIKSKSIKTTVRVDKEVWDKFSNICINNYSQYSKVDLLSQALNEFINKYGK